MTQSDSRRSGSITVKPWTLMMTWMIAYSMGKAAGYDEAERIIVRSAASAFFGLGGRR